jgi:hypothetical protein
MLTGRLPIGNVGEAEGFASGKGFRFRGSGFEGRVTEENPSSLDPRLSTLFRPAYAFGRVMINLLP